MNNTVKFREHYNLYYIFLEDKQNNALSKEKAVEMVETVIKRTNRQQGEHSPPCK